MTFSVAKIKKGLKWDDVAKKVGLSKEWVTAGCLGQMTFDKKQATTLRTLGDLRPGVKVRQGQLIGLAGHSGKTATDRVRLELWREAAGELTMQDPLMIARGDEARPAVVGPRLAGKALERYKAELVPRIKALRQLGE